HSKRQTNQRMVAFAAACSRWRQQIDQRKGNNRQQQTAAEENSEPQPRPSEAPGKFELSRKHGARSIAYAGRSRSRGQAWTNRNEENQRPWWLWASNSPPGGQVRSKRRRRACHRGHRGPPPRSTAKLRRRIHETHHIPAATCHRRAPGLLAPPDARRCSSPPQAIHSQNYPNLRTRRCGRDDCRHEWTICPATHDELTC